MNQKPDHRRKRDPGQSASDLIAEIDQALPGFLRYAMSAENLFDRRSVHGVFASCSEYVAEHSPELEEWGRLAEVLNACVGGADADLDDAARTSFIESVAERAHPLASLLEGKALECWNRAK